MSGKPLRAHPWLDLVASALKPFNSQLIKAPWEYQEKGGTLFTENLNSQHQRVRSKFPKFMMSQEGHWATMFTSVFFILEEHDPGKKCYYII